MFGNAIMEAVKRLNAQKSPAQAGATGQQMPLRGFFGGISKPMQGQARKLLSAKPILSKPNVVRAS